MKIGIICAMQEELDSIITAFNVNYETITDKCFTFYKLDYNSHEVILTLCGIGKVNAAIHTQYIITRFNLEYIINVGVAGNLSPELDFGDVVVANDLVHHDMDVVEFGIPIGQVPRMDIFAFPSDELLLKHAKSISHYEFKIVTGRIATGDQFINDLEKATFIHKQFNALACEMEGVAVAHTCYLNKIPCIVVRALSDMAGRSDKAIHSFNQLKDMVAHRSSYVVKNLLQLI